MRTCAPLRRDTRRDVHSTRTAGGRRFTCSCARNAASCARSRSRSPVPSCAAANGAPSQRGEGCWRKNQRLARFAGRTRREAAAAARAVRGAAGVRGSRGAARAGLAWKKRCVPVGSHAASDEATRSLRPSITLAARLNSTSKPLRRRAGASGALAAQQGAAAGSRSAARRTALRRGAGAGAHRCDSGAPFNHVAVPGTGRANTGARGRGAEGGGGATGGAASLSPPSPSASPPDAARGSRPPCAAPARAAIEPSGRTRRFEVRTRCPR